MMLVGMMQNGNDESLMMMMIQDDGWNDLGPEIPLRARRNSHQHFLRCFLHFASTSSKIYFLKLRLLMQIGPIAKIKPTSGESSSSKTTFPSLRTNEQQQEEAYQTHRQ